MPRRLVSQDPRGTAGQSAYPYVGDDPPNATDPSGLLRNDWWGGCGGPGEVWGGTNGNPVAPTGPTNPDGSCQSAYATEVSGPNGLTTVCAYAPDTSSGPPEAGTQDWAATCQYGYGNNPNGAGCYCGPGQTPYQVGANPYCIPPPVDANGNPVYPANASCANGWDQSAQACVCGPGDAPMSVVGPSGADCVEPAGATYSTGPRAVPYKNGPPSLGSGSGSEAGDTAVCDAQGNCVAVAGLNPPPDPPRVSDCGDGCFVPDGGYPPGDPNGHGGCPAGTYGSAPHCSGQVCFDFQVGGCPGGSSTFDKIVCGVGIGAWSIGAALLLVTPLGGGTLLALLGLAGDTFTTVVSCSGGS